MEDEYLLADEMRRDLEAMGVDVAGPVSTVDRALALISGDMRIDGAVLDINLQGEKAFPVADLLRARGIPFIFATGYDDELIPPRYPGFVLCRKPTHIEEIARALFGQMPVRGSS